MFGVFSFDFLAFVSIYYLTDDDRGWRRLFDTDMSLMFSNFSYDCFLLFPSHV